MAFATLQQLAARIPGGIPSDEEARAGALLVDISSIIADTSVRSAAARPCSSCGMPPGIRSASC